MTVATRLHSDTDYLAALEAAPPWGEMLAIDPADVVRVHFSSGTTSAPTPCCWTAFDLTVRAAVELAAPGSLPRSVHKAKRLVRG